MQHWPPRHKNTLVSPNNAGSVIATVATGTTTQLLAAPPAGYAWLISSWNVVNDDAALTLAYELTEDGNLVDGRAMTAAQIASPGGGLGLTGALSMAVTGAGTSVTISLSYYRVRLTDFVMWRVALTDTFQAVAAIVAPVTADKVVVGGMVNLVPLLAA